MAEDQDPQIVSEGDSLDADIHQLAADLRDAYVIPPSEDVAAQHLAAMVEAYESGEQEPAFEGRRARRPVLAGVVTAGLLVLFGGLATAGALPGPVQDTVASIVKPLGIELPRTDPAPVVEQDADDPATEPGRSGEAPGRTGETPGQSGEAPGRSDEAPGRTGETPGQSGEAPPPNPGQGAPPPGQSGEAPPPNPGQGPPANPGQGGGHGPPENPGSGGGHGPPPGAGSGDPSGPPPGAGSGGGGQGPPPGAGGGGTGGPPPGAGGGKPGG